jgi:hypothetical protein
MISLTCPRNEKPPREEAVWHHQIVGVIDGSCDFLLLRSLVAHCYRLKILASTARLCGTTCCSSSSFFFGCTTTARRSNFGPVSAGGGLATSSICAKPFIRASFARTSRRYCSCLASCKARLVSWLWQSLRHFGEQKCCHARVRRKSFPHSSQRIGHILHFEFSGPIQYNRKLHFVK